MNESTHPGNHKFWHLWRRSSFNIFFLQVAEITSNPMELIRPLISVCWSFCFIGIFCEFGESVTEQFEMIKFELGQRNWYLFPLEMQQTFLIVLANAKQPKYVQGFANVICSRKAFKNVTFFSLEMFHRWNFFIFDWFDWSESFLCSFYRQ